MIFSRCFYLNIVILCILISCKTNKKAENYPVIHNTKSKSHLNQANTDNSSFTYKNAIYKTNIYSVLLHPVGFEFGEPILNLNKRDSLILSFDELDSLPKNYFYTLIHCNSDWTPSDLLESEYLNGFNKEPIYDYESSFNTLQRYTHYNTIIPSEEMQPILSGNYLLIVFENNNINKPIFSKQLMILDEKINIQAEVKRATLLDERKYQHEIDFKIQHYNYEINDPFSNLHTIIQQNNRTDNEIRELAPIFIRDNELVYDFEEENVFDGGNEYRFFDCTSLRYLSERIKNIQLDADSNKIYLYHDKKRRFQRYSSLVQDINGKRLIKVQEATNSSIEADYVLTHFSLPYEHKITHGELYIFGQISDYGFPRTHRLEYNNETGVYEAAIYLKQGYYNYQYVLLKEDDTSNSSFIEGTHSETLNDYVIYVYHRPTDKDYDQLIGIKKISSKGLF